MKELKIVAVLPLVFFSAGLRAASEDKADLGDINANLEWRKGQPIVDVHGHISADAIEKTLALMDAIGLPREVLQKIYYKNAERIILKKDGNPEKDNPKKGS